MGKQTEVLIVGQGICGSFLSMELERAGVIVTHQGKGSFVSETLDLKTIQKEELLQHLEQIGKLAKSLDIPEDKLLNMIRQYKGD